MTNQELLQKMKDCNANISSNFNYNVNRRQFNFKESDRFQKEH